MHGAAPTSWVTKPDGLKRGGKFIGIHSEALLFGKKGGEGTVNGVK